MATVFLDQPIELQAFLKRRRELGQDTHDEVWEGVYHVSPMAHSRHGLLDDELAGVLRPHAREGGLVGSSAFNLGEPNDYRVPDRGYFRSPTPAVYVPTAALVVEILSPDDETFAKFGFYARHDVEEICTADPQARQLRWFRRSGDDYEEVSASDVLGVTVAELIEQIDWPT